MALSIGGLLNCIECMQGSQSYAGDGRDEFQVMAGVVGVE